MRLRRTIARYVKLFRDPSMLFSNGPDSHKVDTIIFPNGKNEIWFQTEDGLGFSVQVSNGPYGLSIRANRFVGSPILTNEDGTEEAELCITQYRQDDKAQAFKRWYRHQETAADVALLGDGYDRNR